ncbi:hypothetical protein [Phormidium tenue]|uniref:Glyoxalase-like domain-containing protein n=1 Tax=Phormidium tenue NIES-30 TaxID=549789 RepID=A0A1U7J0U1_9CYAN|nr:hypothetical protein [Phormidium tenue]MBD2234172.1 hypothetical protein [Phormidium tenue FACHB-1052]OKH45207.1 hypothetical protein NIES30_20240 [Phormidium tenue NIES-30]
MAFELDHLFICTEPDAPAAEQLLQFGLVEGRANVHAGQGTANRCFFFHNLMLELLWVHNAAEAQSDVTRPTYLWARWAGRSQNACPFGVCLRPIEGQVHEALPFPTWNYQPAYFPGGVAIPVATNVSVLSEPMLFYLPFAKRQDSYPEAKAQPLDHAFGGREVTRVSLTLTQPPPRSAELEAIAATNLIAIQTGPAYLMELGFDGETQAQHHDFRPALPLIVHW